MAFDLDRVRKEFPILARQIDGAPLVYLDSGNTSQKPRQVIGAMSEFLETSYAPINRSTRLSRITLAIRFIRMS